MRLGDEHPDLLDCFLEAVDEMRAPVAAVAPPSEPEPEPPAPEVRVKHMSATSPEFLQFLTSMEVI
jgi:hypothetical protein